jgi:hypothetical protein
VFTTGFVTIIATTPGRETCIPGLQVQVQSFGTGGTETLLLPLSLQTHRCTITLFVNPAASIVELSSSSVRFGNVVPIVYARVVFSGRELHACNIIRSTRRANGIGERLRVDETAKIAHSMVQIHTSHNSTEATISELTRYHQHSNPPSTVRKSDLYASRRF